MSHGGISGISSKTVNKGGIPDSKRVDKILQFMPKIMSAKKPFESILAILSTMKAALGKSAQKLTVFVIEKSI